MTDREIRHFHLFCGLGGGARGFNRGSARVGSMRARFRCLGGVDVDAAAIRDFERLAGVPGTVLDMFSLEQYREFHGREPGAEWREAGPDAIRRAAGGERPHIVFLSAPCKGFSGLLSEGKSRSGKYQALNGLTLRGVWLMLEAWSDDPPELIVFENVPRIATRGRHLLDQIGALLRSYGYAVAETTHDCGELGGLAQSRKRFLLVARHVEKVPPFLYEPVKRPLRSVGDVLGAMPLPGDASAGPMHRMPALQWRTWVRLAFVEAGSDWRSLSRLRVADGVLVDFGIMPEPWGSPGGTVTGNVCPSSGRFSVADPRPEAMRGDTLGVIAFDRPSGTVTSRGYPLCGRFAVADPRFKGHHEYGQYGVRRWDRPCGALSAQSAPGGGGFSVADPRMPESRNRHFSHFKVVAFNQAAGCVTGASHADNGPWSVADPRCAQGEACAGMPEPDQRLVAVIRSLDGTWHRPFTTLELAALQGLVDPDEHLELDGLSDSAWRERIGNAVPPSAAQTIAGVMGTTLLLTWSGETFALGSTPIWVRPVAAALMAAQGDV